MQPCKEHQFTRLISCYKNMRLMREIFAFFCWLCLEFTISTQSTSMKLKIRLHLNRSLIMKSPRAGKFKRTLIFFIAIDFLRKAIEEQKYQVIHIHSSLGLIRKASKWPKNIEKRCWNRSMICWIQINIKLSLIFPKTE